MTTTLNELPSAPTQTDRRLVMRLVDYWEDVRGMHEFPLIRHFDVAAVEGLEPNGFLLELNHEDLEISRFRFLGEELVARCGEDLSGRKVTAVPRGSLLSRLTDHFHSVLGNRCPMGFEAEFADSEETETLYRGIMLPLSDTGTSIDYILGAINCRRQQRTMTERRDTPLVDASVRPPANDAVAEDHVNSREAALPAERDHWLNDAADTDATVGEEASLFIQLQECRAAAVAFREAELRSRQALYITLQEAFVLAQMAEDYPDAFQALLRHEGITTQARAPFTPIVKLVFGASYDKTRLSEYASVLAYADRMGQSPQTLVAFLENHAGGIKGCVAAERENRRGEADSAASIDTLKTALRARQPLGHIADPAADLPQADDSTDEFVVLLGRRNDDGRIDIITLLDENPLLVERLLRQAAKAISEEEADRT